MEQEDTEDVRSKILQSSLAEVRSDPNIQDAVEPCVICLDQVSEQAVAKPCGHRNFDFLCILNWLERQKSCPLCKTHIESVEYLDPEGQQRVFKVPRDEPVRNHSDPRRGRYHHRRNRIRQHANRSPVTPDDALLKRRHVYRHRLYSLHVGSNRVSAYSNLTPASFAQDANLVSRAKCWIRRELQVFSFLGPASSSSGSSSSAQSSAIEPTIRSASNAEFLLAYIVAILKTVDIRDSSGHAENLLAEFLGRENAQLFLHELNAWLRSPYQSVEAWDRHVQYPEAESTSGSRSSVDGTVRSDDVPSGTKKRMAEPSSDDRNVRREAERLSSGDRRRGSRRGRGDGRATRARLLDKYVPD